jgi:cell division protein FtsW
MSSATDMGLLKTFNSNRQETGAQQAFSGYDKPLLVLTVLLIIIGSLMIYSSTSVITGPLSRKGISEFFYFKRHLFTVLVGAVCLVGAYKIPLPLLKKAAPWFLGFSLILLFIVFVPGIGIAANGARRWIRLWPSTFQPSELVKLAMVVFLARYLSSEKYSTDSFRSFARPICVMAVFQGVMLKQPDFGAAMSLAFLTISMLFFAGTRMRYLMSLSLLSLPVIYILVKTPYRLKRVLSFLDPWNDSLGSGFQLIQSFIALGSGGIDGLGIGGSKQKLAFLPEAHTDFIFSIIGEEFGFAGAIIVVAIFFFIFMRGIVIANRWKDPFACYLAVGLTLMITLQALINIAVTTGMVPTKGLPLPFISYGGSSLMINMAAIGILLNISRGVPESSVSDGRAIALRRIARRKIETRNKPNRGIRNSV